MSIPVSLKISNIITVGLLGSAILQAQNAALPAPTITPVVLPDVYPKSSESEYQSPARPYNLDIVAPVQASGSDNQAKEFNKALPGIVELLSNSLPEQTNNSSAGDFDPNKLVLNRNYSVRAYFVTESAGFHNTLGFNTTAATEAGDITTSSDAKLIFPDASTPTKEGLSNNNELSEKEPLRAGDFVDLGTFSWGTKLDFFLISKGATNPLKTVSTDVAFNQDGLKHAVGLSVPGSNYLLIGFEDLFGNGATMDMNDAVIALEFRLDAPEPSLALGTAMLGLFSLGIRRRPTR
jgi:hypothetical protein